MRDLMEVPPAIFSPACCRARRTECRSTGGARPSRSLCSASRRTGGAAYSAHRLVRQGGCCHLVGETPTSAVETTALPTTRVYSCLSAMCFENPAMNTTTRTLASWTLAAVAVAFACSNPSSAADHNPVRQPGEDVNSAAVRRKEGLQPNENLLFNGWGVTPAGDQVPISDMALKLVVAPDKRRLVAVSGGFSNHGVTLLDMANQKVAQFLSLTQSWNGLVFSKDGARFFVSGGASGFMHVFKYAKGEAAPERSVQPNPESTNVFLAGIAIHPVTGKLYVCDEGDNEIWVLHPETLVIETTIAVGQFPHSCAMGADDRHLYVSNWGSRSVSVVDTEKNKRVRDITVGLRPNDITVAPDGRLFVACAG